VYGSISGYGEVGPDAARGGFDLILQAESGVMSVTGSEGSGPVKVGAPLLDVGAGLSCAVGLLAAHTERVRTGVGAHVSSSLLEFALSGLGTLATAMFVTGSMPGLLGTHSPTFAPYGGFRTQDGWIVLAGAGSEDLWRRCCAVLGGDDLASDPRFLDNAARVAHREELTAALEDKLGALTTADWLGRFAEAGVPAAEVRDLAQVFDSEQVRALGAVQELDHPTAGPYLAVAPPVRTDGEIASFPRPAPVLGADTRGVLVEAGLTNADVDALVAKGVAAA
jgi:crotonobetainyl-CoA:carnitine CoA-transferase CaiB-like acyl-CoA transferase